MKFDLIYSLSTAWRTSLGQVAFLTINLFVLLFILLGWLIIMSLVTRVYQKICSWYFYFRTAVYRRMRLLWTLISRTLPRFFLKVVQNGKWPKLLREIPHASIRVIRQSISKLEKSWRFCVLSKICNVAQTRTVNYVSPGMRISTLKHSAHKSKRQTT